MDLFARANEEVAATIDKIDLEMDEYFQTKDPAKKRLLFQRLEDLTYDLNCLRQWLNMETGIHEHLSSCLDVIRGYEEKRERWATYLLLTK